MKRTKKPNALALCLSDLRIGRKFIVFKIVDGVVELDGTDDLITTAMTVISTDYEAGTVTYCTFDLKPVVVLLNDLGIPSLESGGNWRSDICAIQLKYARVLVHEAVNAKRDAASILSKRQPIDWTLIPKSNQLIGLST